MLIHDLEQRLTVALKAANYGARAGDTIVGNLKRGGDGRFSSGGNLPVNPRIRPKAPKGKRGKAEASAETQASIAAEAGVDKGDLSALQAFNSGGALDGEQTARLQKAGLIEVGKDGKPRMADNARGLLGALRKGDKRATLDAASRARDAQSKRTEAQAKRDEARAKREAKASAGNKGGQAEQRRQERAQRRGAVELQRVNNRVEEIDARLDDLEKDDVGLSQAERTRLINRLEETSTQLEALAISDADKAKAARRITAALKRLQPAEAEAEATVATDATKELPGSLAVFKQADGAYRWVVTSSNAFEDREDEIVSEAALNADADRIEATKEYGPLRWWHMGRIDYDDPLRWETAHVGPGLDLGACDFVAMHGRMMVESGTFASKEIAEAVAAIADGLQVSRGFTHPADEPREGVYHNIRGLERSLLPKGRAANPFTNVFVVKGAKNMATLNEKWKGFVANVFGGDEAKAKEFAGKVAQTDKELEAKGVSFKEGEGNAPAPAEAPPATEETKADDAGGDEDAGFAIGDMQVQEFVEAVAPMMAKAIAEALGPAMQELSATKDALAATQKELGELKGAKTKEANTVAGLTERVKALEGDAPTGPFVPSRDNPPKTKEALRLKPVQPVDDIYAAAEGFLAGKG